LRVRQVLLNLLSNANKFTDRGSILLKAAREATPPGDRIVLRVTDTGKGMSAEEVRKLFQAFYQADSSSTRKHEGTGLGLAISKRFCNMMGGDIEVTSRPGEGSTFIVKLPAQVILQPGTGSVYLKQAPTAAARAGADDTVLVIDDDPAVRELMERFLGKEGYKVRTAASGEEGLKLVKELRPRAITLDAMMPGIDGWAVLAALKSDPETADIP